MRTILITGCGGLIASEATKFFSESGWKVIGIDNNLRQHFFGEDGNVLPMIKHLLLNTTNFEYHNIDLRDRIKLENIFKNNKISAVLHCAAQASHDYAGKNPLEDFEVNTLVTVLLLEYTRQYCKEAPFVFLSTNKVYADTPNRIKLKELETRYDFDDPKFKNGINESFPLESTNCLHSLYGAGKLAADIYTKEYSTYFGMKTCCLRAGCLTGPNHSSAELHGFISYLIKCNVMGREYNIFGYKGKQVRSQIHSYDIVTFCNEFINNPKSGVYNIGGGKENSISILEAITKIEGISGIKMKTNYIEQERRGDHLVWWEDTSKLKNSYPNWHITKNLDVIFNEVYEKYKRDVK